MTQWHIEPPWDMISAEDRRGHFVRCGQATAWRQTRRWAILGCGTTAAVRWRLSSSGIVEWGMLYTVYTINHDNPAWFMFQLLWWMIGKWPRNVSADCIVALLEGGFVLQIMRPSFNSFTSVCGQVKRNLLQHVSRWTNGRWLITSNHSSILGDIVGKCTVPSSASGIPGIQGIYNYI